MRRGGRRSLSELVGALIASLAILSAAATLIAVTHRAEVSLRESLAATPPLLQVEKLPNGSLLLYNPSSRSVTLTDLLFANGTHVRLSKPIIVEPGSVEIIDYSNITALVAGERVYIPQDSRSADQIPQDQVSTSNILSIWAIIGLGSNLPLYGINASTFCNASYSKLGYASFQATVSPLSQPGRFTYIVSYHGYSVLGTCSLDGARCSRIVPVVRSPELNVTANITIIGSNSNYNATAVFYVTYGLQQSAYVPLGTSTSDGLYPRVVVAYREGQVYASATKARITGNVLATRLYEWLTVRPLIYIIRTRGLLSTTLTVTLQSPTGEQTDARGYIYFWVLEYKPCRP